MGGLRELAVLFVVPGPAGVAIRDRLRVSETDAAVLAEVGVFLGSLAAGDLAERSRPGACLAPREPAISHPCRPRNRSPCSKPKAPYLRSGFPGCAPSHDIGPTAPSA